jgi:hypothetical protein
MAHYAKLDENNIVLEVNVVDNDQETELGEAGIVSWLNENFNSTGVSGGVTWKKTSFNTKAGVHNEGGTPFRKNYAGIGFIYDETRDAFLEPQLFPSWSLNESTCIYDPPTPYPDDGKIYKWNEDSQTWYELDEFGQPV